MSRMKDTLLGDRAYGKNKQAPMVDLKYGGQHGHMVDMNTYVSNANYVKRPLVARLVEAPRGFSDLGDPQRYIDTLKSLIELHPQRIEGLSATLTVESTETPVGGAGEMQQDVTNVSRERSAPSFTWVEKYGKPINAFLTSWITNLIMDPETKYPAVVTNGTAQVTDLLPDYVGATIMFFEPDPTFTKVVEAWLCTNMKPTTSGEVMGIRDLTAPGETSEYAVEFTALTQRGDGVTRFAQRMLDEMNLTGVNPNLQPAFVEDITADVKAGEQGYAEQVSEASRSAIRT